MLVRNLRGWDNVPSSCVALFPRNWNHLDCVSSFMVPPGPHSLPGMGQWLPRSLMEALFCGIGCSQISDTWVPCRKRFQRHPGAGSGASDSSLQQPFF